MFQQKAKDHKDSDKKKIDQESSDDSKEDQSKNESTPVRKQFIDFDCCINLTDHLIFRNVL